jgi:hypothetical protein
MAKKKPIPTGSPAEASPAQPGVGPSGTSVEPAKVSQEPAPETPQPGAVSIGVPISPEAYEELMRKAKHQTPPPPGCAQEDPSASSGDG